MSDSPVCRWGIVATCFVSAWFVTDLIIELQGGNVRHTIQAIGSSSSDKAREFSARHCPNRTPTIYGSYAEVYADPNVDCVYIGTPHSFHKQNCLDATAAGKNVLCEKPFTMNAKEARDVFKAAKEKGVYVAEAMWLRHRDILFEQNAIGRVSWLSSQYNLPVDIA